MSLAAANKLAEEAELDLVEIAPTAVPPVCRIMDYGKYKYREAKKRHEAKLKQKQIVVKEVKFRPGTDEGDYRIKLRNLTRFLEEGDKAKVTLRYRGREMAHRKNGYDKLDHVKKLLGTLVTVEAPPQMNGRFLSMVLVPNREAVEAARRAEEAAARQAAAEAPAQGESEAHA